MKKILLAIAAVLCMSTFAACNSGSSNDTAATADSVEVVVDSLAVDSLAVDSIVADSVACDTTCVE